MLGIGHLRGHETNRLEALVTEITRIGGEARELEDGIEITPVPVERLHGEVMESYADHRMATFAAMIGLAVPASESSMWRPRARHCPISWACGPACWSGDRDEYHGYTMRG